MCVCVGGGGRTDKEGGGGAGGAGGGGSLWMNNTKMDGCLRCAAIALVGSLP